MKRLTCSPKLPTSDVGAFVTYKSTSLQRPIRQQYNLGGCETKVRDRIIALVQTNYGKDPFAEPFLTHLKKIGVHKLDTYSEIEFNITEYNVNLIFKMRRDEEDAMTYTLPDLSLEPDPRLCDPPRRRWFGLF
jgi:hypothetical protein